VTSRRVGLIGWPIDQSLSPLLHQTLYRLAGVDASYALWPIAPDEWPHDFASRVKRDWLGLNVTTPHKERAYAACDHYSEAAMVLGAVNHLTVRPDGALLGDNKDVDGAYFTLQGIRAANAARPLAWFRQVHVLGCGPAARAVGMAYLRFWRAERARAKAGKQPDPGPATLTYFARTQRPDPDQSLERLTEMLGREVDLQVRPWNELPSRMSGLLLNATTACDPGPIATLPEGEYGVWDLNYRSPQLVRMAKESGRYAIDGLPMLVWQGFFSAARWFPKEIDAQRQMGLTKQVMDALRASL